MAVTTILTIIAVLGIISAIQGADDHRIIQQGEQLGADLRAFDKAKKDK